MACDNANRWQLTIKVFFNVYIESPNPKNPEGPSPQAPNPINWKPQPKKSKPQNRKPPYRSKSKKKI